MPELTGFEVLEALGRGAATAGIPVLDPDRTRRRGGRAPRRWPWAPARYMSKPFDVRELIAEVRRHLGSVRAEGARRASL